MNKNLKISDPEEIVRKGLSQMRAAADDITVPEDLSRTIERTVDMELGHRRGRMRLIASLSSVAAAAAVAAVALVVPARPSQPQDTFDTPEEAYAAVMEVFGQIGQNIGKSMSYYIALCPCFHFIRSGNSIEGAEHVCQRMVDIFDGHSTGVGISVLHTPEIGELNRERQVAGIYSRMIDDLNRNSQETAVSVTESESTVRVGHNIVFTGLGSTVHHFIMHGG